MPAVTVDDLTILPRVTSGVPGSTPRPVRSVTTAPRGFEGEGFPVRRAFAGVDLALLDPFIHLDQMGEVEYAPGEPKGTPWHPHRGFETVTYMHRRHLRPPGLQRWRRHHHQRRHPVDDGRRRASCTSRQPPEALGRSPAACSTACSCGSTCRARRSWRRRATRTCAATRSACSPRPTAARCSGSSPARSAATRARGRRTRR